MKRIKVYLMFLAVFGLLLTSCSRDDDAVNDDKLATLSFTTVLNDLVSNKAMLKQQLNIPDCSGDVPAYVAVVLSGETEVGTVENPVVVSVNPNPGNFDDDPEEEYFTNEASELELAPGEYTLEYFAVYNGDPNEEETEAIWVAPRNDGSLANFVNTPLPMTFDLGPGAKRYLDVEVLCFDDRMVNEYGYVFFELGTTQAIEFCVFGNYCDDNGRHFPAAFSVDVWSYADGERGGMIHSDLQNTVTLNGDGDYTASPLCLALPDTSGEDQYFVEITLLDSDAYGDVTMEPTIIRSGVISDSQVRDLFTGDANTEYYHFREGECEEGDSPDLFTDSGEPAPDEDDMDDDGVADEEDNCPETANPGQEDLDNDGIGDACDSDTDGDGIENGEDNCPTLAPETDADLDGCEDGEDEADADGDGVPDEEDNCVDTANADQADLDEDGIGDVCDPDIDGDGIDNEEDTCPEINPEIDADNDGCEDGPAPDTDGDGVPNSEDNCPNTANADQSDIDNDGEGDVCDADMDGDGVPNNSDECPTDAAETDFDQDGCEDATACSIPTPGTGCSVAYLEGETGFVRVTDNLPLYLYENGVVVAVMEVDIVNGDVTVGAEFTAEGDRLFSGYEIWASSAPSGAQVFSTCNTVEEPTGNFVTTLDNIGASYPYYLRIEANVCPAND